MTEETFVRELERRAEQVDAAPLTFDVVRGRAVRIRRRRRGVVAVAVVAAVALVAVVPALLTGDEPTTAPDPAPPTVPGSSVLHDGTLTFPDGGTVALDVDNEDVSQLAVLTDGRIVLAMIDPYVIRVYAADGSVDADYDTQSNVITLSADGDAVAWIGEDFRSRVLASGVAEPVTMEGVPMPGESAGSIDAVLDAEHLLVGDWSTTQFVVTREGRERVRTSEPLRVTDVSPDGSLWAVQYADDADLQYGCSGLYDPDARAMVARSCDAAGLGFAPDGQHLLGGFFDNNMAGEVTAYDLDLADVATFRPRDGSVVAAAAWADAGHVLVAGADLETNAWELARVSLAGEPEVVVPEQPGRSPEIVDEFLFSE